MFKSLSLGTRETDQLDKLRSLLFLKIFLKVFLDVFIDSVDTV
jgi:hypothetical protein